eukprot:m.145214 g.145214  ORF g.145214 m.145214 type:complete len:129 (-) comp17728_c0_seq15:515-901(-)
MNCADVCACVDYRYGLQGVVVPYISRTGGAERARSRYLHRNVTYVSGSSDVCNNRQDTTCHECAQDDADLDHTCEGYAQGWCRMERAHAFAQSVRRHYGNDPALQHSLLEVPGVGGLTWCTLPVTPAV